jgi:hypothetical protein
MVSTHPTHRRDVGEVPCILVSICGKSVPVPISDLFVRYFQPKPTDMERNTYATSLATGHAIMLSVVEKSAAAPGPAGVYDTKPAPSSALLPKIAGYSMLAHPLRL